MDGRAGAEAEAARAFGARVAERTGVSVEFVDERWTTLEAERAMREAGHDARRQRGRSDAVAASLILRTYLARKPA
jgi:putative Holliday junction resolvase